MERKLDSVLVSTANTEYGNLRFDSAHVWNKHSTEVSWMSREWAAGRIKSPLMASRSTCDRRAFWQQLKKSRIPATLGHAEDDVRLRIRACDDEIAFARAYIQELSAQRNTLISSTQFPSEVLASIFQFLLPVLKPQRHEPWPMWDFEIAAGTRSLIAASHVCQRWREVSLEFSTLWTVLWTQNKPWLSEMIDRAKDAPLVVVQPQGAGYLYSTPPPQQSTHHVSRGLSGQNIASLVPQLFHTKQPKHLQLHLAMHGEALTRFWADVLSRPAPSLEVLGVLMMVPLPGDIPFSIPADSLGRSAPAMRSLTLNGYFSHEALWPSPVLRGLVNLTLILTPNASPTSVSLQDTLVALRDMQQLETLTIGFPSTFHSMQPQQQPYFLLTGTQDGVEVSLERLLFLHLKGNVSDTTTLTRHISIFSRADVQYDVSLSEHDVRPQLAEDISALFHPAPPIHLSIETYEISISYNPDPLLCIRCWDEILPLERSPAQYSMSPKLAIRFDVQFDHHVALPGQAHIANIMERGRTKVIDLLNILSPTLPRDQPHDLRWGLVDDRHAYTSRSLILGDPARTDALSNFPETRRIIFDDIHTALDILPSITSNATILRHLTGVCFVRRPLPDGYQLWPEYLPEDESVDVEMLQSLAPDLRRLGETRGIHTLEFAGGFIRDRDAHLFEGIAKELMWS
ncbi:uncharacterized protein STEHIDRAFT_136287 [Stereum hirsutum FP-91666 SS1]|uniref:uncharacterized protein n=1 Tax=Stereum hirsutum (strain FP-91666) TaxID=721885 RepID=UPI000440D3AA|nr:uncharacterized protein STEHIDRAFT_136287 [Stereum hirsutum FP-91666 SS1]EIM92367.1 hypothetical protein STEHIDRAFT_136287 [Stereum hirsutum FP-91666 SS1]